MKFKNVKLGDKYLGIRYNYNYTFLKGIKLVEIEVVKVTPKMFGIAFNKDMKKYPQMIPKDKENDCINKNPKKLIKDYLKFLEKSKFKEHLKESIRKYCKNKLKQFEDKNVN